MQPGLSMLLIVKNIKVERENWEKIKPKKKKKSQKVEPEDLENSQAYQYCKKFSKGWFMSRFDRKQQNSVK